ncbi:pyridoxamine 5'-phosphate oxidase [Rurimicrobium arvi]|uniref:Pyridoxine/pyridoxamine 5'-phosphate oxidase n=1 Tax=Rurimicrobium arvi TaxID=2049916 RepID=A0ABP8N296_9BACT
MSSIADIRTDYQLATLDEQAVGDDPLVFFSRWFSEALAAQVIEVNAMTLATVDARQRPHARIVLLKGVEQGGFVFFTNYNSDKGKEIADHAHAALVFFWPELQRQVRVEGRVQKVSSDASDAYFRSRPAASRIGAWASPQSAEIHGREVIEQNEQQYSERFADGDIPRPEHWGGYAVIPDRIEFWQGRASRLHDRICFEPDNAGSWRKFRLAP